MTEQTILQVVPSLDIGGAERSTIDIARALKRERFRPIVISEGGRMESELRAAGGELIRMSASAKDPFSILSNVSTLASIIRERKVSLIHARSRAPAWSALFAARRTKIPFVTTHHGIYNARGPFKRLYNSVMVRGDAVIANSHWTARHIEDTYGRRVKRMVVIPRGMDFSQFDPAKVAPERIAKLRHEWRVDENDQVILLPGRYTRWKGHAVLIAALAILRQGNWLPRGIKAVIAGESHGRESYLGEMIASVRSNHLEDVVLFAGHVQDMPAAYLASEIVVSASTEPEAFGRIPPEAAAMGRPVIATDHGGARETIIAGKTGLLTKPGDALALADALSDLLRRTPEQRAAMGEQGREHVTGRYSVEHMCAETLALYRDLIWRHSRDTALQRNRP